MPKFIATIERRNVANGALLSFLVITLFGTLITSFLPFLLIQTDLYIASHPFKKCEVCLLSYNHKKIEFPEVRAPDWWNDDKEEHMRASITIGIISTAYGVYLTLLH